MLHCYTACRIWGRWGALTHFRMSAHPILMTLSPLAALLVQSAILSPFVRFCITAPHISSLSSPENCIPTINIICGGYWWEWRRVWAAGVEGEGEDIDGMAA